MRSFTVKVNYMRYRHKDILLLLYTDILSLGEMPSLKPDKSTEKLKSKNKDNPNEKEEGWNLVHESNAIKALKVSASALKVFFQSYLLRN